MPDAEDVRDAAAGPLADIDQVEHFQQCPVPGIRYAAALCRSNLDSEVSGVGKAKAARFLDNDQALTPVVVRVDQAVCQRLPNRFVHRGIVPPVAALHLKGHLQVKLDAVIDTNMGPSIENSVLTGRPVSTLAGAAGRPVIPWEAAAQ